MCRERRPHEERIVEPCIAIGPKVESMESALHGLLRSARRTSNNSLLLKRRRPRCPQTDNANVTNTGSFRLLAGRLDQCLY